MDQVLGGSSGDAPTSGGESTAEVDPLSQQGKSFDSTTSSNMP